jgi:hypothetical protein
MCTIGEPPTRLVGSDLGNNLIEGWLNRRRGLDAQCNQNASQIFAKQL